jgi:hypothetical protein
MSYPIINDSDPEDKKVSSLANQVAELLEQKVGFIEALTAVVTYRYGGRFKELRPKVRQLLNHRSSATVRKNAKRGQMDLALQ